MFFKTPAKPIPSQPNFFEKLPPDLLLEIIKFKKISDIFIYASLVSKHFSRVFKQAISRVHTKNLDYQNFIPQVVALPDSLRSLLINNLPQYNLPYAKHLNDILNLSMEDCKRALFTPDQLAIIPNAYYLQLFLSVYGILAFKEGLLTLEQALKISPYYLELLLTAEGCAVLRDNLITAEQIALIPDKRYLEFLLSVNGCRMLREKLLTVEQANALPSSEHLKLLLSDKGLRLLQTGGITAEGVRSLALKDFKTILKSPIPIPNNHGHPDGNDYAPRGLSS